MSQLLLFKIAVFHVVKSFCLEFVPKLAASLDQFITDDNGASKMNQTEMVLTDIWAGNDDVIQRFFQKLDVMRVCIGEGNGSISVF